ncbi:MAG TPA: urate hydroxylase PuuD, partial [Alphaproteobacteria bacterium]|nr:urate hydroxylase PuuD [Alphaproteobacteria bacterium]
VEKIKVAPDEMPRTLHWFKWEAAFTWMSGVVLLAIVYYLGSGLDFLDPRLAAFGSVGVIIIAAVVLGVAWLVYDALYMSPLARTAAAPIIGCVLLVAAAYLLTHFMTGRAAYLHVGAIMGTMMAANVWLRIIPAQRELVAATKEGRVPDPALGLRAKQRSVHNNYMTLPVVFIMISNHFSSTYGDRWNWAVLAGLALVGAGVRHFFNLRNKGQNAWWIWGAAAVAMIALFLFVRG